MIENITTMETPNNKPIHVKPSFYAYHFYRLKEIALSYGYNLVLHGSLNRDMDLIAVPWANEVGEHGKMVDEMSEYLGGYILQNRWVDEQKNIQATDYNTIQHGRMLYVINLNRKGTDGFDPMYYVDLSIIPTFNDIAKAGGVDDILNQFFEVEGMLQLFKDGKVIPEFPHMYNHFVEMYNIGFAKGKAEVYNEIALKPVKEALFSREVLEPLWNDYCADERQDETFFDYLLRQNK